MCEGASYADETINRLSLGHDNLTQTTYDPKAPAPAVLGAKYGFDVSKDFQPYVGTGIAYSRSSDNRSGDTTRIKAGVAGQFGFSYLLGGNISLSFNYKYLYFAPDASNPGNTTTPQSIGIYLNIKF